MKKTEDEQERNPEKNAFKAWVQKYDLDRPKNIIEDKTKLSYVITSEEVEQSYAAENIELSYTDKAKIVSIIIFQRYKGFGCIDTIRALDINGLNIGVSGSILTYLRSQK